MNDIERLEYKKSDLIRFFTEYTECHSDSLIDFDSKQKRDLFNLTLRPRVNNASLAIQNSTFTSRDTKFDNKIGFGFGLETEFILPFNKNKWSVAFEPTYQNFKSDKTTSDTNVSGGLLKLKLITARLKSP